ncbi:bridging integrator 3-like isoform X2 [Ornithodoros turicata]|uniref:Putative amphiphysin n=1 Tax=Ornithodoros turicata TaxID=34597 RepID=A0A2R5LC40_9ACAR
MSWNPLRRSAARTPPITTGPPDEKHVEVYISKFVRLEADTKKLHKQARKYEDLMLALYRCEKKLAGDLANGELCRDRQELRRLLEDWLGFASEMDNAVEDHVLAVRRCLVDPLKRSQGLFTEVQSSLRRREQTVQERLRLESRLARLEARGEPSTGNTLARRGEYRRSLEAARAAEVTQGALLEHDLPQLHQGCLAAFRPSLEALLHAQVLHWGAAAAAAAEAFPDIPATKARATSRLAALRALSIVEKDT